MKMLARIVAVMAALGAGSAALAVNPGTSSVKAQVASNLSVLVTGTYDFGIVPVSSTTVSASAVTVQNNGTGVTETYRLHLTEPANWTHVNDPTPVGSDTYHLNAMFNTVAPLVWTTANTYLDTADRISSAVVFAGNQNGLQRPWNDIVNLWFRFYAPTLDTSGVQQTINITITATTP